MALAGFMGARKTTLGRDAARLLGRPFVDLDAAIQQHSGSTIAELFERGEGAFREIEERVAGEVLASPVPAVIALGGGAVLSEATRALLRERALTVLLDVDVDTAWGRVGGSRRPLADDRESFGRLYAERKPVYEEVADARTTETEGIVLAAGGVRVETGSLQRLGELVPGDGPVEVVSDARVAGIHGMDAQLALGARARATHELAPGEQAKTVESIEALW
ncbi:MAG: shikimate kinase, partial [Gaiellaceae bacterium]